MATAVEREGAQFLDDYVGFKVEASDGAAGKVVKDTYDTDREHFVVRASLLGRKYELPGDAIIEATDGVVRLGLTKEQIREHPRYVSSRARGGGSGAGPDHVIPL